MPFAARHPCAKPGCPRLVQRGQARCDEHAASHSQAYERDRKSWHDWYTSNEWRRYSLDYRAQHKACVECGAPSEVVDHIHPWRDAHSEAEQFAWFWDASNHRAMCERCHNAHTSRTRRVG